MRGLFAALMVSTAALCAPATAFAQEDVYDPWEGFNRRMFAVHEVIDQNVLEPIAEGYRAVTPQPVRGSVTNFLRNLKAPVVFANDVLQGEPERAATTFARFGLNTTAGVLGIFDPATSVGLERHDEDFGQTLAVWGVPSGPYLWVPVLGPTTLRDGTGRVVDNAFDPMNYAEFDGDDTFRATRGVATGVSAREAVLEAVDDVRQNSVDPYVTFRTTYGLWRHSAIQNGRRNVQDLPEFEDIVVDEAESFSPPSDAATENSDVTGDTDETAQGAEDPEKAEPDEGDRILFKGVKT